MISSAAMCCASAALPPLPNSMSLPPRRRPVSKISRVASNGSLSMSAVARNTWWCSSSSVESSFSAALRRLVPSDRSFNIGIPGGGSSTKWIIGGQVFANVVRDAVFQRRKRLLEAHAAQSIHARLREILIFVAELARHVDEFDLRAHPRRCKQCMRHVQPGSRGPAAHIEQARNLRMVQQPQNDVCAILDIDEVPHLSAIGELWVAAPVEPHRFA